MNFDCQKRDAELIITSGYRAAHADGVPSASSAHGGCPTCAAPQSPRRRSALWWGISGGTVLSVVGWVGLLAFEQYSASLAELRGDLKHFNEISGELVKKESLHKLLDRVLECTKELQASEAARAALVSELKASDQNRRTQARELQRLRERLASVEGRQAATPLVVPGARAEP
jgi:hypothetical protein